MATLKTFMKEQAEDNVIYSIGSSTGYFFIGTKEEYYKLIDSISEKHVNYPLNRLNSMTKTLEYKKSHPPEKTTKIRVWEGGKRKEVEISLEQLTIRWEKEIKTHQKTIETYKKRLEKFKKFPDRKIKEFYSRIDKEDGKILIIEGKEEGAYWYRKEFKRDYKL